MPMLAAATAAPHVNPETCRHLRLTDSTTSTSDDSSTDS